MIQSLSVLTTSSLAPYLSGFSVNASPLRDPRLKAISASACSLPFRLFTTGALLLATTSSSLAVQQPRDFGPAQRVERVSAEAAVRFLDRATFGATTEDILFVQSQGYEAWLDAQLAMPSTLLLPKISESANATRWRS